VHRIGRTGRAGKEGQAVSLVCLDEEGFMQEIERFTKQQIPVQTIEGFGPDEGERAEPIAMGRQTLWGGAGKPPSREVMAAAAKAARSEMMQRIRDNKAEGGGQGQRQGRGGATTANGGGNGGGNAGRNGGGRGGRGGQAGRGGPQQARAQQHAPRGGEQARGGDHGGSGQGRQRVNIDEQPPRANAHTSNSPFVQRDAPMHRGNGDGQPDPLRTSVDSMGGRGRRGGGGGGGGGRGRNGGGGGGYGGQRGQSRSFGR
jgi:ATP-dependent RNA helicase RhlE